MQLRHIVAILITLFVSEQGQSLTFTAGYRGGLSHSSQPSHGLTMGLRLTEKIGIAYSFNYAGIDVRNEVESNDDFFGTIFADGPVDVTKGYIRRNYQEVQFRFHPASGSFFLALGGIAGHGTGHVRMIDRSGTGELERKYKFESQLYSISIGNIWDKSSTMFGFEWIGLTRKGKYSAETTSTASEVSSENISTAERKFLDKMEKTTSNGGITALMMHLGFAI
jgi:hypothetical protein